MKLTIVALLLLGLVAFASAECPNACNGHGRCNNYKQLFKYENINNVREDEDSVVDTAYDINSFGYSAASTYPGGYIKDTCTCYTRKEQQMIDAVGGAVAGAVTVYAWTGYDCSSRTCPLGISWVGLNAITPNDNDHWWSAECSNRGTCDRKTGQCACQAGYEGEGCRRTTCPNQCNGHGVCQSLYQFADDVDDVLTGTLYQNRVTESADTRGVTDNFQYRNAWDNDKQFGCKCDAGYRGPDCSLFECPSGEDPLDGQGARRGRDCSGRGICNYEEGICECFSQFRGSSCETQNAYA